MAGDQPTFSFEVVAALVAALYEKGMNIGAAEYEIMAKIDGTRTASGFEHAFRKVKARAKELSVQRAAGNLTPAKEKKQPVKRGKNVTKTQAKTKRDRSEDEIDTTEPTPKKPKGEDDAEKVKQENVEEQGEDSPGVPCLPWL